MTVTVDDFRTVMRQWITGVTIVTAYSPAMGRARGNTVNSFTSVSFNPLLVSICLTKSTETAQAVLDAQAFGISILSAEQEILSMRFAGMDSNFPADLDRFTGVPTQTAVTQSPLLTEALAWLDCKIWAIYDGSTHHIIVGEVVATSLNQSPPHEPLLYYNRAYRRLMPPD
ncbi:MAG: flavin reductase [Chloroflexi bacterium]|nr:flavin reductase [Chloroflexota bacterium]